MNRFARIGLLLAAVGIAGTLAAHSAHALTIVPPTLDYSLKRGDTVSGKVKLYNESTTNAVTVFASTSNFTAKGEDGEPDFDLTETPTGAATWIESAKGAVTIQPNDRVEVPFTIKVPNDAEPGGHYVSLFFGTDPSLKPTEGGQVTVRSLLGALIIMRVEGQVRETASIASFSAKDGASLSRLPATFEVRVQNTGNVHIRPQGTILIKNLFGGETETLSLNEANGAVLPNSVRKFDATWMKSATDQSNKGFFKELGLQWNNFAFGPYTATVNLTYGQSKQALVASTKVTIIPWALMIIELLVIAILVMVLVLGIRGYNKSIIRKAQRSSPPKSQG